MNALTKTKRSPMGRCEAGRTLHLKVILISGPVLERKRISRLSVPTPSGVLLLSAGTPALVAAVNSGFLAWKEPGRPEESLKLEHGVLIHRAGETLILVTNRCGAATSLEAREKSPGRAKLSEAKSILQKMGRGFIESHVAYESESAG